MVLQASSLLLADALPPVLNRSYWSAWPMPLVAAGAAVLLALLGLLILWSLSSRRRRKKRTTDYLETDESSLTEDLAALPRPPARPAGGVLLSVRGVAVRLRLVVLAPLGRGSVIQPDHAVVLLDQVVSGLSSLARQDRPRVRIWPSQMSGHGFHPRFLRLTHRPEAVNEPSPWILVAGTARIGSRQILVGLALLADKAVTLEGLAPEAHQWYDVLHVEQRS